MYNASFTFFLYQSILWSKHIVRLTPLDPVACTPDVLALLRLAFNTAFLCSTIRIFAVFLCLQHTLSHTHKEHSIYTTHFYSSGDVGV